MAVSAYNVAASALREIGAYSPYDTAPDPSELAIALERLGMFVNEKVGTEKLWFFIPASEEFIFEEDEGEYALNDMLQTDLQFIYTVRAILAPDDTGVERDCPVEIIGRDQYECLRTQYQTSGVPIYAYIERNDAPTIVFLPAPSDAVTKARVQGQKYGPNLTSCNGGKVPVGFPEAWERYLMLNTAIECGRGAVTKIEQGSLNDLKAASLESENYLLARNNKEHAPQQFVKNRDF